MSKGNIQSLEDIRFVPTQTILLSKIKFDQRNPNVLSTVKKEALSSTVNKYGFAVDPWLNDLNDGTYLVIDGEHRIKLLLEKGVKSVKAKIFKVKYVEVQMLRQIANKLRGEHDKTKDADEFKSIFDGKRLDEFAKLLGEPIESFQSVLEKKFDMNFEREEGDIPEKPITSKTKLGDTYQLGNHRVMCGDSTKDTEKLLDGQNPVLTFTDPPFNIDYSGIKQNHKKIENDNMKEEDFETFLVESLKSISETSYVCCNWKSYSVFERVMNKINKKIKSCIIWDKEIPAQNLDKYFKEHEFILYCGDFGGEKTIRGDVWRIKREYSKVHPTSKPTELCAIGIKDSSKESEIIYDPFLGSGSTLIACEQTNRICYGMELDPAYVDVIVKRWENFTGNKAKLLAQK